MPQKFKVGLVQMSTTSDPDKNLQRAIDKVHQASARGEVILFVVKRIVGNMHLAIEPAERTIGIEDCGCIVVHAGRAPLKQRRDEDDVKLLRQSGEPRCDRARNRLRQIEQAGIFTLAEILGLEEFRQADNLHAPGGGLMDLVDGPL